MNGCIPRPGEITLCKPASRRHTNVPHALRCESQIGTHTGKRCKSSRRNQSRDIACPRTRLIRVPQTPIPEEPARCAQNFLGVGRQHVPASTSSNPNNASVDKVPPVPKLQQPPPVTTRVIKIEPEQQSCQFKAILTTGLTSHSGAGARCPNILSPASARGVPTSAVQTRLRIPANGYPPTIGIPDNIGH